jgi:LDH2 family malate/lactate/ureidoglycolate dehydrogenase
VEQFSDRVAFYEHVSELIAYVKSCPVAPGFPDIFVPGEVEFREAQRRRETGIIIDDHIWQQIEAISKRLGAVHSIEAGSNGARLAAAQWSIADTSR